MIGSTGSGKSTIAKMLLRLHDVTDGSVRFSGADVRSMTQHDLRERIAYVPQKAWSVLGHHRQQLARWPCRRDRDRDAPRPRRGPIRLCVGPARAPGRPGCPGRHEFLRRPAPAPGHRPRPHEARGPLYLRRQFLRPRLQDRCGSGVAPSSPRRATPPCSSSPSASTPSCMPTRSSCSRMVALWARARTRSSWRAARVYREIAESQMKGGE